MSSTLVDSNKPSTAFGISSTKPPWHEKLRDGTTVLIRPIQETDSALEQQFIERLSAQSRRYRFLGTIKSLSAEMLRQFVHPELVRGVAFIALIDSGPQKVEIGVCRYSASADRTSCECAVTVSDEWQGQVWQRF